MPRDRLCLLIADEDLLWCLNSLVPHLVKKATKPVKVKTKTTEVKAKKRKQSGMDDDVDVQEDTDVKVKANTESGDIDGEDGNEDDNEDGSEDVVGAIDMAVPNMTEDCFIRK